MIAEDVRDLQSWLDGTRLAQVYYVGAAYARNEWGELIERAHHLTQHFAGDVRIARRRIKLRMSQSHLDQTDVDTLFEKMGREAVTQCMW